MAERTVASARKKSDQDDCTDNAYEIVKSIMNNDRTSMWTSVEISKIYENHGGSKLSRKALVDELVKGFSDELITLYSPGLASLLVFRKHASTIMKITESDDDSIDMKKTAKRIKKEILEIDINTHEYQQRIDKSSAKEPVSDTLKTLLSNISNDLSESELPAILIGNIITSIVRKKPTTLLIDLAIQVQEKELIDHIYDYRVVCSYYEIKRFRASAAVENTKHQSAANLRSHRGWFRV